jgi:hypothetical protein
MEACYGGTDVMERSCAVARGIDINSCATNGHASGVHLSWALGAFHTYTIHIHISITTAVVSTLKIKSIIPRGF